jgi:hypothetical protein
MNFPGSYGGKLISNEMMESIRETRDSGIKNEG